MSKIYNIGDIFELSVKEGKSDFYIFSKRVLGQNGRGLPSEYEYFLRETENKIGIKRCLRKLGSELEREVAVSVKEG